MQKKDMTENKVEGSYYGILEHLDDTQAKDYTQDKMEEVCNTEYHRRYMELINKRREADNRKEEKDQETFMEESKKKRFITVRQLVILIIIVVIVLAWTVRSYMVASLLGVISVIITALRSIKLVARLSQYCKDEC